MTGSHVDEEMAESDVVRQRAWTEAELLEAGFCYYERKREMIMARELPPSEAPMTIKTSWDTLVAEAGYMICYRATEQAFDHFEDYDQWPVSPDVFAETYLPWEDTASLNPAERQLLQMGCRPYYKAAGVWARQLTAPTWVQSMESPQPILMPAGAWLCVGAKGEPWTQSDRSFRDRYLVGSDGA